MKKYKVLETLNVNCGQAELDDKQAARRKRVLRLVKKGLYEILAPTQFKKGEVLGLKDLSKVCLTKLKEIKEEKKSVNRKS